MMRKLYLYVVVFISGAAVLAVEILGTRILGPFYGVSLFLWSALITVTLAALSLGYAVGGRWADKNATLSRLCILVAGAGAWLLLIPWIKQPLLMLTESLGLRFAVLSAAFVLFAPPLTLLGMVSPYAIKLKTASLSVVGRTAGNLYAISTVASVVSALLTGFFLIPNVGVERLTLAIGALLLITAAIGLFTDKKSKLAAFGVTGILFLIVAVIWSLPSNNAAPEKGLLAVEQSPYAEIRVLDTQNRRYLLIDGGTHTIVDPSTWQSHFPYVAVMDLTKSFFEKPEELLLVGLGGGSVVKNFAKDGWKVDAVEIDPVVIEVAQNHFGLESSEGNIFQMDGRQYLLTHEKNYEIIAMDAFGSSSIPFHLVTAEAFALIASRLMPDGVLAINIESLGWHHILVRSLAATLKKSFSHVLALPTYQSPETIGNIIILASNRALNLSLIEGDITDLNYVTSPAYLQNLAWHSRFTPDIREAPVLTDDLNPVDIWAEATNLAARRDLHRYFKESGLSW
ncbi:fused MFS/spermidine synthase [candidate division KSB1 bacterium]|nr:fused MFS/spermidine synthase [candidate division KSB1 bacterium]